MRIDITLEDTQAVTAINRMIQAGKDLTPVLRDIGEHLLNTTRQRFDVEQAPGGAAWEPLSETTKARKTRNTAMDNALLYADDSVSDPRMSKILVMVGHLQKLKVSGAKRQRIVSNPVRTAAYVDESIYGQIGMFFWRGLWTMNRGHGTTSDGPRTRNPQADSGHSADVPLSQLESTSWLPRDARGEL